MEFLQNRLIKSIVGIGLTAAIMYWLYNYGLPAAFEQTAENFKNFKVG